MNAPFYPGQPDYFDKLNEMDAGVAVAIEIGEGAAGAAAAAAVSASDAAAAQAASDAAAASALSASQAAASDAASAQILVGAVPTVPFPAEPPWAIADKDGQPILWVTQDGTARALLDRLPGLDMLNSVFAHAVCDRDGYVLNGVYWDGTVYPPPSVNPTNDQLPGAAVLDGRFAWSVADAQGVIVFGIQWDGQVYTFGQSQGSALASMIVRGDLWATGADGLPVQVTQATEIAAPTLSGATINFLARARGGFVKATAAIPSSDAWAPFITTVLHVLATGQSLGMGTASALDTINPQCANVLRTLWNGVRLVDQDGTLLAADCLPLKPLVGNTTETPIVQHVGQLQRIGGIPRSTGIVASLHGRGGYTVAQLSKGTLYYSNAITAAQAVYSDSVARGLAHRVPYVDIIQGEANRNDAPGLYSAAMLQLQSDFETDLKAITGQAGRIPMLLDQIANWTQYGMTTCSVPLEQLELSNQYPDRYYCAGPKYWLETGPDGLHLVSLSSRRGGAMHARAAAAILAGASWSPTKCISAIRVGNVVTLRFYTPSGRLVADTVNVSDPGNLGIRWVDSTSSAAVSSVRVNLDNTVTVTLSAVPTGANAFIGIADAGISGAAGGPFSGPRACLRDSSTDTCGDGLPLYNWACNQTINVT